MLTIKEVQDHFKDYSFINTNQESLITGFEIDSRNVTSGKVFFALKGDNTDGHNYLEKAVKNGAILCVISENYQGDPDFPYLKCASPELFLQKLAMLFRRKSKATVIAITGTNGKTTTKDLLVSVLEKKYKVLGTKGNFNNLLGVPITLGNLTRDTDIAVIEMGINHFGELTKLAEIADPDYGFITNIGNGHLEALHDLKGVLRAKTELFNYLEKKGKTFFLNSSDKLLADFVADHQNGKVEIIDYAKKYNLKVSINKSGQSRLVENGFDYSLNSFGLYNALNAQAAAGIGRFFNVSKENIKSALRYSKKSANRGEILKIRNTCIIKDCYNANPTSLESAITMAAGKEYKDLLFVLGDMLELGEKSKVLHENVAYQLKDIVNSTALLYGKEMEICFKKLKELDYSVKHFYKQAELKKEFQKVLDKFDLVLIKGSRRMELEKLLEDENEKHY